MTHDGDAVDGDGVTLVPIRAEQVDAVLRGGLSGLPCGRGWPHPDSAAGLSFAATGGRAWVVVQAGVIVGECGTKGPADAAGVVEIGYGLAAPSRGRGVGTRAVAALVGWLERQPDVRQVEAESHVDNLASRRLLERLGFEVAGVDETVVRYRRR